MRVTLICIGTELLNGKVNTNSAYIGEKLSTIGIDLSSVVTVGDNMPDMENAFRCAFEDNDVVLTTGGLGPTFDDITREAVSNVLGRKLVLNSEALSFVTEFFARRGIEMPANNKRQGQIIDGARIIPNKYGTAPGQIIDIEIERSTGKKKMVAAALLPGPPREMRQMFDDSVFPYLRQFEHGIKKSFTLHIFGIGESQVDEKIRSLADAEKKFDAGVVDFTILVHQMIVDIKASVRGKDEMLVDEMLHNIKTEFLTLLGNDVYGENNQTLESVVGELLLKNKKTLSVAESCTGGLLAGRVTAVAGSSLYFRQGAVVYSNESKIKMINVPDDIIKQHGAVSEETARAMAEGMRKIALTDYALSVTGIAGPGGGTQEKPAGLVYIGICGPDGTEVSKYNFGGTRFDIRERALNQSLDMLRRKLLKLH